jgi:hypothetical protein
LPYFSKFSATWAASSRVGSRISERGIARGGGRGKDVDHRQHEAGGLAGAGLGDADDVLHHQDWRNGLRWMGESEFLGVLSRPTRLEQFVRSKAEIGEFLAAAADLLGERGLTRDPDLMRPWLTDWRGRYSGAALALASPASTEEVAALVRLCARHGVPIVPQGGNSGMSGGATPDQGGKALLLSLRRMDGSAGSMPKRGRPCAKRG